MRKSFFVANEKALQVLIEENQDSLVHSFDFRAVTSIAFYGGLGL